MTLEEEAKALADYRLANYKGNNDTTYFNGQSPFDVQFKGFIGEVAIGRCFGFDREHLWHIGTDGGSDYAFKVGGRRYTLDVKTAGSDYGLTVKKQNVHRCADILVLCHYIGGQLRIKGWALGSQMAHAKLKDLGSGPVPTIPTNQLQPMQTLCGLLARRDL